MATPSVVIDPSDIQVLPTQNSGTSKPQPAQSQNISADDIQVLPTQNAAQPSMFPGSAPGGNMFPGAPASASATADTSGPGIMNAIGRGITSFVQDIPNPFTAIKNAIANPGSTAAGIVSSTPAGQAFEGVKNSVSAFESYEKARASGASVADALRAASDTMQKQDAAAQMVRQRAEDFKKDPSGQSVRALLDAAGLAAAYYIGEGAGPSAGTAGDLTPEIGAETAEAGPGLVKRISEGKEVAQAPAKAALESGAEASAKDAGIIGPAERGNGIRTMLAKPIQAAADTERSLYDTVNEAAETDMKDLFDRKEELLDALNDPTNIANRKALASELATTDDAIKVHSELAASKGVSMDTLNEAKAATQQRFAMEALDQKLFNNESVVSGDVAHGVPETINVEAAIRQVQNLDKPSRFAPRGTPTRLVQALGEDGAKALKQGLYDAQAAGQKALKSQQFWLGVLKKAGIGGGIIAGGGALFHAIQ